LVAVLWIFIFLFVVALDFAASVREEGMAARHYAEEGEAYYLALAGFEQGLYRLLERPVSTGQGSAPRGSPRQPLEIVDGIWREGAFGEGLYRVRLVDEGGKIHLNRVDEETLRRVFTSLGVEEPRKTILVDSISDWRDADDLHRVNGAESDYYLSLSPSYTAKNGPFDTVEELLWVRGVTAELFYGQVGSDETEMPRTGLKEIFTVDSPMERVNLSTASSEVVHALTGLPLERSREFVAERKNLSDKTLADLLRLLGLGSGDAGVRQFVFVSPSVITIEAAGHRAGLAPQRQVRGVVRMAAGQQGFQLIRWVDRVAVRSE
jgi:general secretion pathway protein K